MRALALSIFSFILKAEYKPAVNSNDQKQKKKRIAVRFGAKVTAYGEHAHFQTAIISSLLPIIASRHKAGMLWLDAGCGNGMLARHLQTPSFNGTIFGFDIADSSLKYCTSVKSQAGKFLCADVDHLPFKNRSVDGMISTSVLQWVPDLEGTLRGIITLLKPGGTFLYAIFTDNAFHELSAIRAMFELQQSIAVPSSPALGAMLDTCGFVRSHDELLTETMYFPSAMHVLKHLSHIGSTAAGREQMSRSELVSFCKAYEDQYRTEKGVPLTYTARLGCAEKELHHV